MSTFPPSPIEKIVQPIQRFIRMEKAGGIVLGCCVIVAMILANSPLADTYHHVLSHKFGFQWDGRSYFNFSLHHWINDGLMAVFFFVVGLELKREIIGGELSQPRKALLPIGAAIGGMLVPAVIYLAFNAAGPAHSGWGIPMATDIAFALGVLFLLGKNIPLSLKVFLTALAIVDDLGAVLVIAFFYTSDISLNYLLTGGIVLLIMYAGNKLGVRNFFFYVILGIGGLWTTFLLSGVHATIAAVLAAFTIPADVKIKERVFIGQMQQLLDKFRDLDPTEHTPTLTNEQLHVIEQIRQTGIAATPPLQRLEHTLHPIVSFVIIPLFALANAGVSLSINLSELFSTNVAIGVALGLLVGKVVGVAGATWLMVRLKVAPYPTGMNIRNLFGIALLAAIGFTMSLFITSLAFTDPVHIVQAKIGIFAASIAGGIAGYIVLNKKH